jgi:drug/metabolite transporter (DMT)-like permease
VTGHERVERRRVAGLLVGFAGVALLVGFDVGSANLGALLAIVGVVVGYALGPLLLARYLAHLPALGVVAASIGLTAIGYLPVGLLQRPSRSPSAEAWLSVVGLAIVCTALAFLVFFALIAEVGPARATVITYVNPAVAIALGVLVLGESLTVSIIAGFVLILAGSVLATVRDRAPDRAAAVRDGGSSGECLAEPIPEP